MPPSTSAASATVAISSMKRTGTFNLSRGDFEEQVEIPRDRSHSLFDNIPEQELPTHNAARVVQFAYRSYRSRGKKLHRANLSNRLLFEWQICVGAFRLALQMGSFALLLLALWYTPTSTMRALYRSMEIAFDFEGLKHLPDRDAFFDEGLKNIANRSKDFFALSSKYFESDGGGVELLRNTATFTASMISGSLSLPIMLPEFSFSVWVRIDAQFRSGYLVRKRLAMAGAESELTCFGWHLDQINGPSLHFGASDYFSQGLDGEAFDTMERMQLPAPVEFPVNEFHLLTVVVTFDGEHQWVNFYHDLTELGKTRVPRPITDCYNNLEGYLVGESGMTLAQLRFYPRVLTLNLIKEVHVIGTILGDLATGSQPTTEMLSPLESFSRNIGTTLAEVDQRVAEQQPRAEVDLVLQAVDVARQEEAQRETISPQAPFGKLPVALRVDAELGREYFSLLEGPYSMTEPPAGQERFFDPEVFPRWTGTGMSVSMWIRKTLECPNEMCGTYVFSAHPQGLDKSMRCYSAWLEKDGVYFDNLDTEQGWHYKLGIMEDRFHLSANHWRHVAFVWDVDTDDWLFYQDGKLAYKTPWGSSVAQADCAGRLGEEGAMRISVASRFPGWTYGVSVSSWQNSWERDEYFDMRMYVGKALSAADVAGLAAAPTPLAFNRLQFPQLIGEGEADFAARAAGFSHLVRCTPASSDSLQDSGWRDLFGHSCQWFFDNMVEFPDLCSLPDARINCPIACKAVQPCLDAAVEDVPVYYAWSSIRKMERESPNGTLCLQSKLSAEEVVEQCRQWREGSVDWREDAAAWLYDMGDRVGGAEVSPSARVNLTECEEVLAAIDADCSFDADAVRNFTRDVKANGGDYTIGFWIKPVGERSMHSDGHFYPSVSFLSTISPPASNLAFARYWTGAFGEARYHTSCPPAGQERRLEENVEFLPSSDDGWTFLSFARRNSSGSSGLTVTDLGEMREDTGAWKQCLYDEEMLFNAVEVNYPMLLSPIMMVPKTLPIAKLQEIYYLQVNDMKSRPGPLLTNAQRKREVLDVKKRDLQPRSILMATPLLFTTRVLPTSQCPYSYSRTLLAEQHSHALESKCSFPFRCSENVVRNPAATISCAGESQRAGPFFELQPREVKGDVGFADLLYSIADNEIVFRDGEIRETRDFIDSLTQRVLVLLVFFTPEYGITSVLEVDADVSGPNVEVETRVLHYTILEGDWLYQYCATLACQVVVALIMAADVINQWRSKWKRHSQKKALRDKSKMAKSITDLVNIVMILTYVALQLPRQWVSANETNRILGSMASIEWASSTITLEEKKGIFFESVVELLDTIGVHQNLDMFLNVILLVSLLRIIQCTSLHPRLALLTGTLARAADDLWHTSILIVVIMVSFAGIGTWRFGSQYEDFATFEASMRTEFKLMFGEFVDYWGDSRDLQAFVVLYYLVVFFLIVNFLLAIIVESYMQVRRYNEEIEYEMEFFSDLAFSLVAFFYGKIQRWPSMRSLGAAVGKLNGKLALGYGDLYRLGLFRRQKDVEDFLLFYSRLECLLPPTFDSFAHGGGAMSEESRKIVQGVANLLNVRRPKLKDVANFAELRRIASEDQSPPTSAGEPLASESLRGFHWASVAAMESFKASRRVMGGAEGRKAAGNGLAPPARSHSQPSLLLQQASSAGSQGSLPAVATLGQVGAVEEEDEVEASEANGERERRGGQRDPSREGRRRSSSAEHHGRDTRRNGHGNSAAPSGAGVWNGVPGRAADEGSVRPAPRAAKEAEKDGAWARAEQLRVLGEQMTKLAFRVAAGMDAEEVDQELRRMQGAMAAEVRQRRRRRRSEQNEESDSRAEQAASQPEAAGLANATIDIIRSLPPIELSQAPAELC